MRALAIGAAVLLVGAAGAMTIAQVGRGTVPALDTLPSWAGGRPDVAACEQYITGGLGAPATYRRVSILSGDTDPLTPAAFDRKTGISPPPAARRSKGDDSVEAVGEQLDAMRAEIVRQRVADHELRLRRMVIDYDAANGFGVPIRTKGACLFRIIDGRLEPESDLDDRAGRAADNATTRQTLTAIGKHGLARRYEGNDCCL